MVPAPFNCHPYGNLTIKDSTMPLLPARTSLMSSLVLIVLAASIALTTHLLAGQEQLYVKCDTLQQTMLTTRSRLRRWQSHQQLAREAAKLGAWQATVRQAKETPADVVAAATKLLADAASGSTDSRWQRVRAGQDTAPVLSGVAADFLVTTISLDKPLQLTLEMSRHEKYGGFAYRPPACGAGIRDVEQLVWINGQPVDLQNRLAEYPRTSVAERRGWHDLILIDLPLQAGVNQIVVSLDKGTRKRWFNSVSFASQPVPAIWTLLEHDFPRGSNQLINTVPYGWFDATSGWFSSETTQLECELVAQLAAELDQDGTILRSRMGRLIQQKVADDDQRWLDLCVAACELQAALGSLDSLQQAASQLAAAYAESYPGQSLLRRITDLRQRILTASRSRLDPTDQDTARLLGELTSLKYEALVTRNPLLAGRQLLFVKRYTYDSDHYYDEFIAGLRRFGGNLCLLSIDNGEVTEIAPQLGEGIFDRYDLSYDARKILFSYKPQRAEGFRIYEADLDGSHIRQITFPPADELERMELYATCQPEQLARQPGRYGHWTDDMHPCYLPDGGIVFTSTRSQRSVLCGGHGLTVTNLYRTDRDGNGLHQLSQGALSEFCPSVMNDGRIMYNRWEYVDKGAGAVQSLWAMCPDGSRSEEVYGNNITTPGVFTQARHVPGHNNLVVALGCSHCPGNMGAIVLIDLLKDKRTVDAMTALTPGCVTKGNWGLRQHRNGRWITDIHGPWYCDPYPLTDYQRPAIGGQFFLVSCNPDAEWNDPGAYGLYLLDVHGNRVLLYEDAEMSCWQPRPVRPRPVPPNLSQPLAQVADGDAAEATVLVADVYQGLSGVPRGEVKYLRVMEQIARPWSAYLGYQADDQAPGQMVAISLYTHLSVKVLHGVVPVHADGSAFFTVPADRNIFLQALDEDFMEIQRMRTFVNFQPGEQRSCIGCHEPRNQTPVNRSLLALKSPPTRPQAQPGETAPRPLHYPTDVQPILDRHCVGCHDAEKPDGELDLTGTMTDLFSASYENIINRDLVGYIQEFVGPKPEGADAMGYAPAVPPYTYGSHSSKLMKMIIEKHQNVELSREEIATLATWVDANAPFYGSYFGRRNITHREDPDFRPVPTLDSALGIRDDE
jgi:hypothetical protein